MKLRDDKTWEQATTSDQFAEMYRKQIREAPARAEPKGPAQIRQSSEDGDVDGHDGEADDSKASDEGEEDVEQVEDGADQT